MNDINIEAQEHIQRLLEVGAQYMGLQRTCGLVLSKLYIHECMSQEYLSVKQLSESTNLSTSTISSICSQLETMGIITSQSDGSSQGRGRRKIVFSLRIGIQDFLEQGIKNHLNHVRRILLDIKAIQDETDFKDTESHQTIDRVVFEISQFLNESPLS